MQIADKYAPQQIESKWYDYWIEQHIFHSEPDQREPYTIVIPPPNVTGMLHMGHMLNNTLQDVLIRRARMSGKNACWVPGMDHASIATEAKVVAMLHEKGIEVMARIDAVAGIQDTAEFDAPVAQKDFPATSDEAAGKMKAAIAQARAEEDSVGGVIQCRMLGVPAGLGEPMFGGLENRISQLVFAIPAVKGIEFGLGFEAAKLRGSENNDAYRMENGSVVTETNHCGGILGGISNGMPIIFRAAVKPTPSIGKPQNSVRLSEKQNEVLHIHGRHDPCIVPRAVPCMEAAAAIAIFDALAASGTYRR